VETVEQIRGGKLRRSVRSIVIGKSQVRQEPGPITPTVIDKGTDSDLDGLIENFGLPIRLWMISGSEGSSGPHRFTNLLPKTVSPLGVTIRDNLFRKSDMCDNFVEEQSSGFLFRKHSVARNKEGVFCEFANQNKDRVVVLAFRELPYEVHCDHLEWLRQDWDWL